MNAVVAGTRKVVVVVDVVRGTVVGEVGGGDRFRLTRPETC
jgi:hypothetical protein